MYIFHSFISILHQFHPFHPPCLLAMVETKCSWQKSFTASNPIPYWSRPCLESLRRHSSCFSLEGIGIYKHIHIYIFYIFYWISFEGKIHHHIFMCSLNHSITCTVIVQNMTFLLWMLIPIPFPCDTFTYVTNNLIFFIWIDAVFAWMSAVCYLYSITHIAFVIGTFANLTESCMSWISVERYIFKAPKTDGKVVLCFLTTDSLDIFLHFAILCDMPLWLLTFTCSLILCLTHVGWMDEWITCLLSQPIYSEKATMQNIYFLC